MNDIDIARSIRNFKAPGVFETIRELFTGIKRPFDTLQVEVSTRCPGSCLYCPQNRFCGQMGEPEYGVGNLYKTLACLQKNKPGSSSGMG